MRTGLAIAVVTLGLAAGRALAQDEVRDMYICEDERGRKLVTSEKSETNGMKCRVSRQRLTVVPPQQIQPKTAAKLPSPAGFPKEDAVTRAAAKDRQREIIARELAQEEAILMRARRDLVEQEATRYGDEKSQKNVVDRVQKYRENVELHEKNVQELRKELGNIR